MTAVLLGLRFLLEICLLVVMGLIGWGAVSNHLLGALVGLVLALIVATVWGVLLSPRRRIDLPLALRVAVELVLFGTAAIGLSALGHAAWGITLFVVEVVVLGALWFRGLPPGSDAAASGATRFPA